MDNSNFDSICKICKIGFNGVNHKKALNGHLKFCSAREEFMKMYFLTEENLENKLIECGSVSQFILKYPFKRSNTFFYKVFKEYNIDTSIKKASNSKQVKEKRIVTNLKKYGSEHNFCKDHPSRKKWEKRMLEEEGITNVFQRDSVKQKSKETMLSKYKVEHNSQHPKFKSDLNGFILRYGEKEGELLYVKTCFEKGKSLRLNYYIEKYGDEEGLLKYQERIKKSFFGVLNNRSVSQLSIKIAKVLNELNILYDEEFIIQENDMTRIYDFKIGNILIELNGDFWHANPEKYLSNDLLNFPGQEVKASFLWEKDKIKKELAEKKGYEVVYFWEKEINTNIGLSIIKEKLNKYAISENKKNKKDS